VANSKWEKASKTLNFFLLPRWGEGTDEGEMKKKVGFLDFYYLSLYNKG